MLGDNENLELCIAFVYDAISVLIVIASNNNLKESYSCADFT